MSDPHGDATSSRVNRQLTWLRVHAVASTVVILWLAWTALGSGDTAGFDRIEVGRIDVISESGLPALSIAGHGRLPGPTSEGVEYAQDLSGGRTVASGMIFFNDKGDEVGGLTYHGRLTDDGFSSYGGITFDQFQQDQVVSLQYQGTQEGRRAGVHVWDRSTEIPISGLLELVAARREATGAARDSLDARVAALRERSASAHRIFLGSEDGTATLTLEDTSGRPRIRMFVDSTDVARLEFLDGAGAVVQAYPDGGR
jgi:hypothetical protein